MEEPTFINERRLLNQGYRLIAGADEAGRGPLAGPVVAAAVILPPDIDPHVFAGIRDSKQLSEIARDRYYELIIQKALGCALGQASPREIEQTDIRKASILAMKRAVENLLPVPDYVLVDGRDLPKWSIPGEAIVKGDQKSVTIGAASIIAKVTRDRVMHARHLQYPQYGFDHHVGYPTRYHRTALQLFGPCELHRTTFAPVANNLLISSTTPAFHSFLKKLEPTHDPDKIMRLRDELDAYPLATLEREYLLNRCEFLLEALHREERLHHPANVDQGAKQESLAIEYLRDKGYTLWERNFHCSEGEIDLIVNQGSLLVFVEVKSRTSTRFGMPYEAVTPQKRSRIIRAADRYLYERGLYDSWTIRYDILSILAPRNSPPQIEHFEDAFRVENELA